MNKLLLSEIANAVSGKAIGECEIDDISIDSRNISKNTLYVAIIGERFDGHTFCKSAEDNGAVAFMVSKEPIDCNRPYVLVDDTEEAFLKLSKYYLSKLNIKRVAVTGSVGKTTTKEMTHAVLSMKYKTLKTQGNLNNQIGLPRTIFSLDDTYEAGVFELGMSDFGEISRLSDAVRPQMAIITKIGVSHMETLGSREGIMKAKLEVLDGMAEGTPLFVSADDDYLGNYTSNTHRVVKFGIKNKTADYIAEDIKENGYETEFTVVFNGNKQKVTIPTIGEHNVYDALSAFAVGIECGVSPKDIATGLNNYKPSGMRQNVVNHNGITVIEDCYNASPDSMNASIKTLDGMKCDGKKIAVLADMLELGHISKEAHYNVGKWVAESNIDILLCYGGESKHMEKGAKDFGQKTAIHFDNKDDLNEELIKIANKGDIILFKGSRGMALEDSIKFLYNHTDK